MHNGALIHDSWFIYGSKLKDKIHQLHCSLFAVLIRRPHFLTFLLFFLSNYIAEDSLQFTPDIVNDHIAVDLGY